MCHHCSFRQPFSRIFFLFLALAVGEGLYSGLAFPSEELQQKEPDRGILAEIFLSPDHKGHVESLKQELATASITRVRIQFFRLGHPPENIAIGREIPADTARLVIRLATTYNRGVKYLLPQYRFFPKYIAIGSSAFDEASNIPIAPEDLKRLADPALTTSQFHTLYRSLTGEDKSLSK